MAHRLRASRSSCLMGDILRQSEQRIALFRIHTQPLPSPRQSVQEAVPTTGNLNLCKGLAVEGQVSSLKHQPTKPILSCPISPRSVSYLRSIDDLSKRTLCFRPQAADFGVPLVFHSRAASRQVPARFDIFPHSWKFDQSILQDFVGKISS